MQNKETDLNQKSNEAALASQEQVLPLVGELKGAELDFVAGGGSSTLNFPTSHCVVCPTTGNFSKSHSTQKKRHSYEGYAE